MKQLFALLLLCSNVGVLWGQGDVRQRGSGGDQSSQPAQSRRVSGRILDAAGQPVVGATVSVLERTSGKVLTGTYTDANGNFAVNVDPAAELNLRITSVGYANLVQLITAANVYNLTLQETGTELEEQVISTGYSEINRKSTTGTIYSISGDEFRNMPVQNFARAVQGRIAGVAVTNQSGVPGSLPNFRIRGIGSINAGTQPLYIIDGIRVNVGPNQGSQGADRGRLGITGSILNSINPNDIETFTVLTEASATAPYGAEGANGVVLITTRKGKAGKTKIDLDYSRGTISAIRAPDLMNAQEYTQYVRESYINNGTGDAAFNSTFGNFIAAGNDINHFDELYRNGTVENIDVGVSGGNERTQFSLSTNYNFTDAQVRNFKLERGIVRSSVTHKIDDTWKVSWNNNLSVQYLTTSGFVQNTPNINNPTFLVFLLPPLTPMFINGDYNFNIGTAGVRNYESELRNYQRSITYGLLSSVSLEAQILPWLRQITFASIDYSDVEEATVANPLTQRGSAANGAISGGSARDFNYQLDARFNMAHTFVGSHNLGGTVFINYQSQVRRFLQASGQGLALPTLDQLINTATPVTTTGNQVNVTKINFGNQVTYNYKERYFFTASLGVSGSSRFGTENRFGYFPSASAAVRLTQEPWFPQVSWLNELKLRGSYGETGNDQIGAGEFLGTIGGAAGFNYSGVPGLSVTGLGNGNLGWETNVLSEVGMDAALFEKRVNLTVVHFRRFSQGLLFSDQRADVESFPGANSVRQNIGDMENVGWELTLGTKNIDGEFTWSTSFNLTYLENKVLKLPGDVDQPANGIFLNRQVGSYLVAKYAGVNPADGRPFFLDRNQNITYFPVGADDQFGKGNIQQPTFFGGMQNTFTWKGLTLGIDVRWEQGRYIFNNNALFNRYARLGDANNTRDMLQRWTTPGQVTGVPLAWNGSVMPGAVSPSIGGSGLGLSSAVWEDASFIRLNSVSLSYDFPTTITSKLGISNLRLYFEGVNLATYTPFTGVDPELTGNDIGVVPQARTLIGGIRITL